MKQRELEWEQYSEHEVKMARKAFYALCTHIDHQMRVVIGTLREERLLDNTIILFTSDHGEMLGKHGRWAMRRFYEEAANIPMLLVGASDYDRVPHHHTDGRLASLQDVMPTLLDLAGIPIPSTVEGLSMVGDKKRHYLYGEYGENGEASRMIRTERHKLIYYPVGNRSQLFDLQDDPEELHDLAASTAHSEILGQLTQHLIDELYGLDKDWVVDGKLAGLPDMDYVPQPNRGLCGQRGTHWPAPPQTGQSSGPLAHN
jgi:arylsulfatase A-like enzyme